MMLTLAWTCVVVVGLPLVVGMCLRSGQRRDASAAGGGGGGGDGGRGGGGGDEPNKAAAGTAQQEQAAAAASSGVGIEVAPGHGRAAAARTGRPALPTASGNTAAPAATTTTTTPAAVPLPPARYKVMTYNILAPDYANPAWFPGTNRGQLKWQTRQPGLFKTIAAANADLLCLQEVQVGNCRRSFEKFLKKDLGYDMAYSMKCTEEADPAYDSVTLGVLACWKRAKFRQVGAARTIALAQHVAALFGGDRFYSAGNWQVAVAVLLEPLSDDGAVDDDGDDHDRDRDSAADTANREAKRYVLLLSVHMMAPRGDHDYRRKYEQLVQTYALTRAVAELKAAMVDDPTRPFVSAAAAAWEDSTYARMGVAVPWEPAGSGSGGGGEPSDGGDEQSDDDCSNAAGGGNGSDTEEAKDGEVTGAAVAAGGRERAVHDARVAVLLCGDFNAPPESASYALLRRGVEDARQDMLVLRRLFADTLRSPSEIAKVHRMAVADLDAGGLLLPAFDSAFALVEGTEPRHTNFTAKFRSCIDYIFVEALDEGGDGGGGATRLSSWLRPVAAERSPHFELDALFRGTPQRSLPSDRFPSDHLPVVVTVEAAAVAGGAGH